MASVNESHFHGVKLLDCVTNAWFDKDVFDIIPCEVCYDPCCDKLITLKSAPSGSSLSRFEVVLDTGQANLINTTGLQLGTVAWDSSIGTLDITRPYMLFRGGGVLVFLDEYQITPTGFLVRVGTDTTFVEGERISLIAY